MWWVVSLAVIALLPGCGGESDPDPANRAGSGSGATGGSGAAGGSAGSSAGSSGATAGSSGSGGASGSAGAPHPDCSGAFGAPSPVLSIADTEIGSLALSADELELIYMTSSPIGTAESGFARSVRASKSVPFATGERLSSLDAACADPTLLRSGDLSADGLRFYFVCYQSSGALSELRLARRTTPTSAFVVDATTYGQVRSGPSISWDELSIYTSPESVEGDPPNLQRRPSTSVPFREASLLAGLESVLTPDISSDRFLFGTTIPMTSVSTLVVSERPTPTDAFGPPQILVTAPALNTVLGSAAVSDDCRSLYYIVVTTDSTRSYSAMVMKR